MSRRKGISWRRATGLYYARRRLTVAQARIGGLGRRDVRIHEEHVLPEELAETIARLRSERVIAGQIVCGLDPRLLFSVTRRVSEDELKRGPGALLQEHVGPVDGGTACGMLPLKLPAGGYHAIYACERATAADMLAGLGRLRESQRHCVPVVQALLPALRKVVKPKRSWRTWVALIPGAYYGLALVIHGQQVAATRLFKSHGGQIDTAVASATLRGLRMYARDELQLGRFDSVAVCAPPDGDAQASADELAIRLDDETPFVAGSKPFSLDDELFATCLAELGLAGGQPSVDLFHELTEARGALDHLPTRQLAGVAAAVLLGAGVLAWQAGEMESKASNVRAMAKSRAKHADVKLSELSERNKAVKKEVELAAAFAVDRVFWEDFVREIPSLMPATMFMTRIDGRNGIRWSDRSQAETKLTISAEVPLEFIEGTPPEVTAFTQAVEQSEIFREKLPKIRGSNVRFQTGVTSSLAKLVLLCTRG